MPIDEVVRRYGRWGGPRWSAGKEIPVGERVKSEDWDIPAKDSLDKLFVSAN